MGRISLSDIEISKLSKSQLQVEVAKLAKRANVRLSQLEESGYVNENLYQSVYKKAIQEKYDFLVERRGAFEEFGNPRFTTKVKSMKQSELRQELKVLQDFINAKMSTVSGIKEVHKKAYETFATKYPNSTLSFDEWEYLMKNKTIKKAFETYESDSMIDAIEDAKQNGLDIGTIASRIEQALDSQDTLLSAYSKIVGNSKLEKARKENPDANWNTQDWN